MSDVKQLSRLPLIAEKRLQRTGRADLSAFCSPHDLIAIPTDGHDVVVYRLNGQVAFTVKRKTGSDAEVTAVEWKPDGASIAVGWSNGTYEIRSGEDGRLLSQGSVKQANAGKEWKLDLSPDFPDDDDEDDKKIVCRFGWQKHHTTSSKTNWTGLLNSTSDFGAEDFLDAVDENVVALNGAKRAAADLPKAISLLDATDILPKLSAISAHGMPMMKAGTDGAKFSSQVGTDTIFQLGRSAETDDVDVLLVGSDCGDAQVLMDESVRIGTLGLSQRPILSASNPDSQTHVIVSEGQDSSTSVSFVDLPLDTLGSPLLHVITKNTKRIQDLLAYITHTVRCIQHDYTTGISFPTRLLNNINNELEEKNEGDIVFNLYHLAMTGEFNPTMLEWLTDIVKEPNHKRWHASLDTMYGNIQSHIFTHLLPALDRLSIALTTLRGYAEFHEGSSAFDMSPRLFTNVLSGVDSMRLLAQRLQLIVITESRHFRSFSRWLKVMIEVGAAGPFTKGAAETEEREFSNLDYPLILSYIKDTMIKSEIENIVQLLPNMKGVCSKAEWLDKPFFSEIDYETTRLALGTSHPPKQERSLTPASWSLPAMTVYVNGHVRICTERITQWQSSMLKPSVSLELRDVTGLVATDVRLVAHKARPEAGQRVETSDLQIALFSRNQPNYLRILTVIHPRGRDTVLGELTFSEDQTILDLKFLHDHVFLALIATEAADYELVEIKVAESEQDTALALGDMRHSWPQGTYFKPARLLAGGRPGKEVCVVFGEDGKSWQVLDVSGRVQRTLDKQQNGEESVLEDSMDIG